MRSTTVDRTSPSGLGVAPQWIEHLQLLDAQHRSGLNISKCCMRSTTVDRIFPSGLCATPQWIEHLQVVYVQYHSG